MKSQSLRITEKANIMMVCVCVWTCAVFQKERKNSIVCIIRGLKVHTYIKDIIVFETCCGRLREKVFRISNDWQIKRLGSCLP